MSIEELRKSTIEDLQTGCWNWNKCLCARRYGNVRIGRKMILAHRAAWEAKNGEIPKGMYVLHRCDNTKCINPDHLFIGTQMDNVRDMHQKGRARKAVGTNHRWAKLTDDKVRNIRFMISGGSMSDGEIGRAVGISRSVICHIKSGRTWKHVK